MPIRCLIVDDNSGFRQEMAGLVKEQGLEVVGGAASAAEALQQIAELRPDVALIGDGTPGERSRLRIFQSDGDLDAAAPEVVRPEFRRHRFGERDRATREDRLDDRYGVVEKHVGLVRKRTGLAARLRSLGAQRRCRLVLVP